MRQDTHTFAQANGNIELNANALEIHDDAQNEKDQVKAMKRKNPVCSLGWSIADNRIAMIILQSMVIALCGFCIYVSFMQYQLSWDIECEGDQTYFGPYSGSLNNENYGCNWPLINTVIRVIPPFIGIICGIATIILSACLGAQVIRAMNENNDFVTGKDKIEYYDIYGFCYFRVIRKIIGHAAYLHFISFGLDLCSFFVGNKYSISVLDLSSVYNGQFQLILYISLPVAMLLRLTHGSMYQREYKVQLGIYAAKGYHGSTVTEHNVAVSAVARSAIHDIAPSVASHPTFTSNNMH